jgi:uncharacterized membrane protein (DUF106 family)
VSEALAQAVDWLNILANAVGRILLAPIGFLPGWLSATLVALATGVLMLLVFKFTSNQRAIKRVRDNIKANLLSLSLFKDCVAVSLRAQGRIVVSALRLLVLAVVPMLVMFVPMCLLLSQLALWYQARPLRIGEDAVVTLRLAGPTDAAWPRVQIESTPALDATIGPVSILSQRAICWKIVPRESGYHRLVFDVAGQKIEKELAVGEGFMRVSLQRPGLGLAAALLHPWERPFSRQSPVSAIEIEYPTRSSWTSGSNSWLIYWFVASMLGAFAFRKVLKVNI